jgi:hypothetical protein
MVSPKREYGSVIVYLNESGYSLGFAERFKEPLWKFWRWGQRQNAHHVCVNYSRKDNPAFKNFLDDLRECKQASRSSVDGTLPQLREAAEVRIEAMGLPKKTEWVKLFLQDAVAAGFRKTPLGLEYPKGVFRLLSLSSSAFRSSPAQAGRA